MQVVVPQRNYQLARIFGIRIGVGISWFFVLFLFILWITGPFHEMLGGSRTTAYVVAVASVLSFFASLILHELGHALVARRNGLTVAGIDLWAFGGITRTGESKNPGMEFRVAVAGPLATLAVIVVCVVVGRLVADNRHFFEVAVATQGVHATPVEVWLSWVAAINAAVLIFNLIPAFPLDGGRMAHAAIWSRTGDRNRATHATGRTGQALALALGALGLWGLSRGGAFSFFTLFLAFFLYQAASTAVAQGSLGKRIQNITVADIMDRDPVTIPARLTLLDAHEQFFLRYRWPWFAVVDPARHFLGVVRGSRVDAEITAGRPALPVVDVLEEDMPVRIAEGEPLEALLSSEGLRRLGAMVAVDDEGILQGVVTLAQLRRALRLAT
jgi:Zn-dependent protease